MIKRIGYGLILKRKIRVLVYIFYFSSIFKGKFIGCFKVGGLGCVFKEVGFCGWFGK